MTHWINGCEHAPHEFLGTVRHPKTRAPLDVYLWTSGSSGTREVCVRFGNAAWEYYSPGEVHAFLDRESIDPLPQYINAILLIEKALDAMRRGCVRC